MNELGALRHVEFRRGDWFTTVIFASSLLMPTLVGAKSPKEIFSAVAPSIVVVEVSDASGKLESTGSGVVIARGEIITNCHVAAEGKLLRVKSGNDRYSATIHSGDRDRDLCRLSAPGLLAPPAVVGDVTSLSPGARVVAIGAPEGLELSISEGLVSGLRDYGDGSKLIQTTAAISPGSSGGGLFDDMGRLVGFTTFFLKEGQSLNFALPVNWIDNLPKLAVGRAKGKIPTIDWFALALALERKKNWHGLLVHGRSWTRAEPEIADAWFSLGEALSELGQQSAAIDAYREALRLDPMDAISWNNLGFVYGKLDQTTKAAAAYRETLRLDPANATAWYNLANSYRKLGKFSEAIAAYRETLRLDQNDASAWYNLGRLYHDQGNRSGVIEAYQILRKIDPARADSLFDIAIAPN